MPGIEARPGPCHLIANIRAGAEQGEEGHGADEHAPEGAHDSTSPVATAWYIFASLTPASRAAAGTDRPSTWRASARVCGSRLCIILGSRLTMDERLVEAGVAQSSCPARGPLSGSPAQYRGGRDPDRDRDLGKREPRRLPRFAGGAHAGGLPDPREFDQLAASHFCLRSGAKCLPVYLSIWTCQRLAFS